jgi:TolB protein
MRRSATVLAAAATATTAIAVAASVASATLPGSNGRIAFRRFLDAQHTWGAIFTIEPSGKGERQVTHPPKGTVDDQPDWSPDGTQITFERCGPSSCRVATVAADGTGLRYLTPACEGQGLPLCSDIRGPAFAPDGEHIVYGRVSGQDRMFADGSDQAQHFALVLAGLDGAVESTILQLPDYRADLNYPQFSPDGRRLVFEQHNSPLGKPPHGYAVVVVGPTGKGMKRLTPWSLTAGDAPDWSPDGKWIVFHSNIEVSGKQSQIYVVHPNGTGLRQLTHFKAGTIVTSSSFSPDGKWIVLATSGEAGNADIFVMRANGADLHPVTRTALWDSAPDWGPTPTS